MSIVEIENYLRQMSDILADIEILDDTEVSIEVHEELAEILYAIDDLLLKALSLT